MPTKFPSKTTPSFEADLQDNDIIAYAYFFKQLLFKFPFSNKEVMFKGKQIHGF